MKKLDVGLGLAVALCVGACSSQKRLEPPGPAEQCRTAFRGKETRILPATAPAGSEAIALRGGEALCLAVEPGERWVRLQRLEAQGDASDLSLRLRVDEDGTTLSLKNPLDQPLSFDALVTLENGERYPSSTCPARPHEDHREHWDERLEGVVLSNFSIGGAQAASCE